MFLCIALALRIAKALNLLLFLREIRVVCTCAWSDSVLDFFLEKEYRLLVLTWWGNGLLYAVKINLIGLSERNVEL